MRLVAVPEMKGGLQGKGFEEACSPVHQVNGQNHTPLTHRAPSLSLGRCISPGSSSLSTPTADGLRRSGIAQ